MQSSGNLYTGRTGGSWARFQWQPGDPHDPSPPMVVESAAAPPAQPVLRSCAGMMGLVLAAWSVVTVAPLFASVVLAHTNDPTVAHPSRQAEQASVIRALHPEPAWDAQAARKLPVSVTAVPVSNPPFGAVKYRGEWPPLSWDAQLRPKLVPITQVAASDNPPFGQKLYRGEWPALDWRHQARAEMVPGSEGNAPPVSAAKYRGEWPLATWEAQARPKRIPGSEVSDPIPSQRKYTGEWPSLSWEAQQRPRVIPSTPASVDAPVPFSQAPLYGPLSNHYAPATLTPLWVSTLTSEGVPVAPVDTPPFSSSKYRGEWPPLSWDVQARPKLVPMVPATVDDPPFQIRSRQAQPIAHHWIVRTLTGIGVARYAESVDVPPPAESRYRGEWPQATWEAQRSRQLPVAVTAVPVNDPPFSASKYRGEWPAVAWEAQARPKLVPIAPYVPKAVRVRNVVGAVPTLSAVSGGVGRLKVSAGAVPTLDEIEGA